MLGFFDKIDGAIRNWLCDCFGAVSREEYYAGMRKAYESAVSIADQCEKTVEICKTALDTVDKIQHVAVSIPSTRAPWYEDEEFSRLLWDKIKNDFVTMYEGKNKKYAIVAIIPKEVPDDLS